MVNIFGKMDGVIKEIFKMIKDKGMVNYSMKKNAYIKDNGKKEKNYHKNHQIIK
jgi:Mn-dependent DtxR family transcriptional regulator